MNPLAGAVVVAGTLATAGLLLDSANHRAVGLADVDITTVPLDALPPTTRRRVEVDRRQLRGRRSGCGVKLRTADHAPATPAEFTPRTRQKWVAGRELRSSTYIDVGTL